MSTSVVKLLHAAAEIVGGTTALAERLGIGEELLAKYMADLRELPDALLLRIVDIILSGRQSIGLPGGNVGKPDTQGLPRH